MDKFLNLYGKENKKVNIDEFITNHHHVNYCEAIIYADGTVGYAEPSHLYALIIESGKTQEEIDKMMPVIAMPIVWITDYTKCVPVWTVGYMEPECGMNHKQKESLNKLIENGLIGNKRI